MKSISTKKASTLTFGVLPCSCLGVIFFHCNQSRQWWNRFSNWKATLQRYSGSAHSSFAHDVHPEDKKSCSFVCYVCLSVCLSVCFMSPAFLDVGFKSFCLGTRFFRTDRRADNIYNSKQQLNAAFGSSSFNRCQNRWVVLSTVLDGTNRDTTIHPSENCSATFLNGTTRFLEQERRSSNRRGRRSDLVSRQVRSNVAISCSYFFNASIRKIFLACHVVVVVVAAAVLPKADYICFPFMEKQQYCTVHHFTKQFRIETKKFKKKNEWMNQSIHYKN